MLFQTPALEPLRQNGVKSPKQRVNMKETTPGLPFLAGGTPASD